MLCRFGFGHVWLSQGNGNVEIFFYMFKQRISDICTQNWSSDLTSLSSLDTCCTFKSLLEPENIFIVQMYGQRKALVKLRCSNHKMVIERLRGTLDRESGYCKSCLNLNNTYVV